MTLWSLHTSKVPYRDDSNISMMRLMMKILQGHRPPIPDDTHPQLKSLLERCWSQTPSARPTFQQIENELNEITDNFFDRVSRSKSMLVRRESEVTVGVPLLPASQVGITPSEVATA